MQNTLLAIDEHQLRCRAARQRFESLGLTIADWSEKRGYSRELVYAVLSGRVSGKRGLAHHVAVDLGIKPAPDLENRNNRQILAGRGLGELAMDHPEEDPPM